MSWLGWETGRFNGQQAGETGGFAFSVEPVKREGVRERGGQDE